MAYVCVVFVMYGCHQMLRHAFYARGTDADEKMVVFFCVRVYALHRTPGCRMKSTGERDEARFLFPHRRQRHHHRQRQCRRSRWRQSCATLRARLVSIDDIISFNLLTTKVHSSRVATCANVRTASMWSFCRRRDYSEASASSTQFWQAV